MGPSAAGHTRAFDDMVAWLAVHTSKTAITVLLRIAWATVGAIVSRVVDDARAAVDPFDGPVRLSAWIWGFSSIANTAAATGGFM